MHKIFLSLATSFALAAVVAIPSDLLPTFPRDAVTIPQDLLSEFPQQGKCDLSQAKLELPDNQQSLTVPPDQHINFVTLGLGTQNYTCNSDSKTFNSVGALVQVIDISCLVGKDELSSIQNTVYDTWNAEPPSLTTQDLIDSMTGFPTTLGQHYFNTDPSDSSKLQPIWDFRPSSNGDSEAFVAAAEKGHIPAPTCSDDVDWLQLQGVEGGLADTIFRVKTRSGQPPASCNLGDTPITVKFTTQYWMMKNN